MRNKIILSASLLSVFLFAGVSFAQTTATAPAATSSDQSTQVVVVTVATVNIQNAKILSQTGNQLNINFTLTNRVGA